MSEGLRLVLVFAAGFYIGMTVLACLVVSRTEGE